MILLRCYPKITDFIYELFNHASAADYRFLPVYSYGFWVAMGFLAAATLAANEMRRREKLGLLTGQDAEITVGEKPNINELIFYFLSGFILSFKIFGIVAYQTELSTYQISLKEYFLSMHGSYVAGIIGAVALSYYYHYTRKRQQLEKPEKKKIKIYPSDSLGDLVVIAAILGVLGSNFFNFLENPDDYRNFWSDPLSSIFSGLSVYGGLICAGIGFYFYARVKKFSLPHFFDSVAPGFMLANGLGRLGCQTAGDGDWGIPNVHPKPDFIPQFFWSSRYEHNIIDADSLTYIPNCTEEHCHQLAQAAYPTPIYEFLMCAAIFLILWSLRKKLTYKPGMIFSIFMILIGIQRYAIEQFRDLSGRKLYDILGLHLRQSELISIVIFIIGCAVTAYLWKYYNKTIDVRHKT